MIALQNRQAKELGIELLVYTNEEEIRQGINPFEHGSSYMYIMKTQALKIEYVRIYGCLGGGRRDDEKSWAKERIFFSKRGLEAEEKQLTTHFCWMV